ncbi:MAG: hypothetical protein WD426_03125 [Anditalea sp.]
MKRNLLLCMILWHFSYGVFSQETNDISKLPPIKKGEIMLTDGTSIEFSQLTVLNDTVVISNSQSRQSKYAANGIYKISKTGNYAVLGAITGGLGGLSGGITGTQNWNTHEDLKEKKTSFIVGATLVGAALGGITGALIKREKIVYKNSTYFSLKPGMDIYQDNK